jgi:hypothetical protein
MPQQYLKVRNIFVSYFQIYPDGTYKSSFLISYTFRTRWQKLPSPLHGIIIIKNTSPDIYYAKSKKKNLLYSLLTNPLVTRMRRCANCTAHMLINGPHAWRQASLAVILSARTREVVGSSVDREFPPSLEENAGRIRRLCHYHFLPNPFHFICRSVIRRYVV